MRGVLLVDPVVVLVVEVGDNRETRVGVAKPDVLAEDIGPDLGDSRGQLGQALEHGGALLRRDLGDEGETADVTEHARHATPTRRLRAVPSVEDTVNVLESRLRPLEIALAEAWWESSTRSSPEADARRIEVELARREVLANPDTFAALQTARDGRTHAGPAGSPNDFLPRCVDLLYDACLPHQVPAELRREIVELETRVESTFNNFRGTMHGQLVDDNTIAEVLRTSDDGQERHAAWEAAKQIGGEVASSIRQLAVLRNDAARALGFRDHFALALACGELDEARLLRTLDEVDDVTAAPFRTWKAHLDGQLAARFACALDELRPWHLDDPFFQSPPATGGVALDDRFAAADLEALTVRTYDGIGLDVRPVLSHSDLYGRPGKSQHAFCIDIDRDGDVRVLCNVEPSERWMETMLHEFGHAIYDREVDRHLPWLVRGAAHALTTEGVAMLFGRLTHDPRWLGTVAGVPAADVESLTPRLAASRRAAFLVFARWVLVMTHFERALYADPGQDLDDAWWSLVERYQLVSRPPGRRADDWASKIHLAVAPVYYQNYLYGELVASQLHAAITARSGELVDNESAGHYLAEQFFAPGAALRWDHLIERATGEPLTARHLVAQLGTS